MDKLLEANEVSVYFGGIAALDGLKVNVNRGEILGFIGPNGSGKTTFINVLTKMYSLKEGTILFNGERIDRLAPWQIGLKGIARTFQNIRIFSNLTVLENVMIGRHQHVRTSLVNMFTRPWNHFAQEKKTRQSCLDLLHRIGLSEKSDEIAKNLSYGEMRRLELARALATKPHLLLLDEPTAGMNHNECETLSELLRDINKSGITLLMIEHNMRMVMNLSDRVICINSGQLICEGSPKKVQNDQQVQECYLGKEEA